MRLLMFRILRGTTYGVIVGIALAMTSCAVATIQKQQRVAVVRSVLCEQLKALGRMTHDESLCVEAERIAHEEL